MYKNIFRFKLAAKVLGITLKTRLFLIFLATLVSTGSLQAAPDAADLWLTKTYGIWRKAPRFGYYQVVVFRQGIEHTIDKVAINIIEADDKAQKKKIIKTIELASPDIKGYVQDIQFKMIDEQRMAISLDISMKAMEGVVEREIYIVSPDGKYKLLIGAEYKDVFE